MKAYVVRVPQTRITLISISVCHPDSIFFFDSGAEVKYYATRLEKALLAAGATAVRKLTRKDHKAAKLPRVPSEWIPVAAGGTVFLGCSVAWPRPEERKEAQRSLAVLAAGKAATAARTHVLFSALRPSIAFSESCFHFPLLLMEKQILHLMLTHIPGGRFAI